MTRKLALIIGGTRGIGAATSLKLREAGWQTIDTGRAQANLGRVDETAWLIKEFKRDYAQLDALIICAGEWYSQPLTEQIWRHYEYQYALSVRGPLAIIEGLHTPLAEAGGVVVVVSSTRGLIGGIDTGPYSLAKAAQIAMIQGYAREDDSGIRYHCVCPGLTNTELGAQVIASGGAKPGAIGQSPESVATQIVALTEIDKTGLIIRVVDSVPREAKWSW